MSKNTYFILKLIFLHFSGIMEQPIPKWHAHVAHMPKHMNMVGWGPLWWGLNPALEGLR